VYDRILAETSMAAIPDDDLPLACIPRQSPRVSQHKKEASRMSVDTIAEVALTICAILLVIISHVALCMYRKQQRVDASLDEPKINVTTLASVHYDRSSRKMWLALERDASDLSAPEWTELGRMMSEWVEHMWKERTQR
jgi:hypothetical protein